TRLAQSWDGKLSDNEELVGAPQHALRPGEPLVWQINHQIRELASSKIEKARHKRMVDCIKRGQGIGRREQRNPGTMARQEDFEQVGIEAVGGTAHALELNIGNEIEIISNRSRLQIEIDQTYRWR